MASETPVLRQGQAVVLERSCTTRLRQLPGKSAGLEGLWCDMAAHFGRSAFATENADSVWSSFEHAYLRPAVGSQRLASP